MEKVGIEIDLVNAEQALQTIKNIEAGTKRLGAKKTMIKLDDGNLMSVEERIKEIQDKLAALKSSGAKEIIDHGSTKTAKELNKELTAIKRGLKDGTANAREFSKAFNSISSKVAHVGSAMQSLGNSLTRLTSPFSRLTTGLLMGAGYKALNLFTEGLSNTFERADTMKNFDRSLKALGLDAEQTFKLMSDDALTAKENLDLAVQGLPTSLDEIMSAQKVYAGATGEMVESTKTAIAANNAFLASTTDSRQQRLLQRYFVALASGTNLTATQWTALRRNMPLVFREIGRAMGYVTKEELADLEGELGKSDEKAQEFLKTFKELGTGGAIREAAMVMTKSWSGLFSNIQIAVTRMGEGVIKTVNETFEKETGRDLLSALLGIDANGNRTYDGIRDWINGLSESIQNWIKANPDKLIDFFNQLKAIDWTGLIKGFAEGMKWFAQVIGAFASWASGKNMERIGRWMPKLNVLGKALTVLGGFLKGTRHIWAILGVAAKWIGSKALGGLGKLGLFGKLSALFGKGKGVDDATKTAGKIPKLSDTFRSAFASLEKLITASVGITLVAGTGAAVFASAKSILKNLKEMVDLVNGGGWDNVGYVGGGVILAIGAFTEIFNAIGEMLGPQGLLSVAIASAASVLVTGTIWADTKLILESLRNIKNTILEFDKIASAIDNMQGFTNLGDGAKEKIQKAVDAVIQVYDLLQGANGSPKDRGQVRQGIPMFTGSKSNAIKNVASAVKSLQDIITNVNKLATMGINQSAGSKMKQIGKVVEQVFAEFPKLVGSSHYASNLSKGTDSIASSLINIRRMAYHINKLGATNIDTEGWGSFVKDLKMSLDKLKALGDLVELDVEVKLAPGFQRSVNSVITKINNAARDINNALKKIPSSYSKTININLNGRVNTKGLVSAASSGASAVSNIANSIPRSSGGMVYRAKGGSIPNFRRRGTDTVPAMLTPGEWVHNKQAVNTFGIDFMRKVNNLDIRGAMGELMHRAGGMANVNRGTVITNNNYNNQRVTINNNAPSGAGFTFKRASRFVGAF